MEGFATQLALDPTLLRGMRHSLASWLDVAGASSHTRDAVVIGTHEAAANVMRDGDLGTIDVEADREDDGGFVVHVRHVGPWAPHEGDTRIGSVVLGSLLAEVSTQSSTTLRMREIH